MASPARVERWTVTPSRKTLRSPARMPVSAPENDRSCGSPPRTAPSCTRLPAPSVVPRFTTAWARTSHPSPRATPSSTTAKGADERRRGRAAPGERRSRRGARRVPRSWREFYFRDSCGALMQRALGLLLFLPVPVVLLLFTRQPLGALVSIGVGVGLVLTHRLYARPFALARASRRCLWCGGEARGDASPLALEEPLGRTEWRACAGAHRGPARADTRLGGASPAVPRGRHPGHAGAVPAAGTGRCLRPAGVASRGRRRWPSSVSASR